MVYRSGHSFINDIRSIIMTKKVKKVLGITIPLGALLLTCVTSFIVAVFLALFGDGIFAKTIRNPDDYGTFRRNDTVHETECLIFPETLENVEKVNEYIYSYDSFGLGGTQIYLDVCYDKQTFQYEVEYWGNYTYPSTRKKAKLDKGVLFNKTTYVFCYNISYLYISFLEEENRVIYVFIEPGGEMEILIPQENMPKNYYDNEHGDTANNADKYYYNYAGTLDDWYE